MLVRHVIQFKPRLWQVLLSVSLIHWFALEIVSVPKVCCLELTLIITITLQQIGYLPHRYNGDVVFEFPPLGHHGHNTKAKLLRGMDRRYDGHVWSYTIKSNIQNALKLLFCTSYCLGHLRCNNHACEYLQRDHRTSKVNETKWEGLFEKLFEVGSKPPTSSTVVCKSCNVPPTCVALCPAKIYYVPRTPHMTRVCVLLGSHDHPVKSGDHRNFMGW